jgi:hypothetical protein
MACTAKCCFESLLGAGQHVATRSACDTRHNRSLIGWLIGWLVGSYKRSWVSNNTGRESGVSRHTPWFHQPRPAGQ